MRFSTRPHQFYCGIDLHARTMYLCILNQDGEIMVHRNMRRLQNRFSRPSLPIARTSSSAWNVSSPGTGWLISVPAKAFPSSLGMPSI